MKKGKTGKTANSLLALVLCMLMVFASTAVAFADITDYTYDPDLANEMDIMTSPGTSQNEGGVCYISSWGEEKYYKTLKEAVEAANDWEEIIIVNDVSTEAITVENKESLCFNLDGHTIKSTSEDGLFLSVKGTASVDIYSWTEGAKIEGTVKLLSGSTGSLRLSDVMIENEKMSPVIVEDGVRAGSNISVINCRVSTTSETAPAVALKGNTAVSLWDNEIVSGSTGLLINGGNVDLSGNRITADKIAVDVCRNEKNYPIKASLSFETLKAENVIYEKCTSDSADTGEIKLVVSGGEYNGSIYSENCKGFITGGLFAQDVSAFVDPAYVLQSYEEAPYHYIVDRRLEGKGFKTVSSAFQFEDGDAYEDVFYYETFKDLDFAAKVEQIQDEAVSFQCEKCIIKADNDVPVSAVLGNNTALTVNKFDENKITAVNGCEIQTSESGNKVTYTAVAKPIADSNVVVTLEEKHIGKHEFLDLTIDGTLSGATKADDLTFVDAVSGIKKDIVKELNLDQSTAAKALKEAQIKVDKAENVKIVLKVFYDTSIYSTVSRENEVIGFGLSVQPSYQAYVTTANTASEMVLPENASETGKANAVAVGEVNELSLAGDNGKYPAISLKAPVPSRVVLAETDKLQQSYYPEGNFGSQYFYVHDCNITTVGGKKYFVFSAEDGFGDFDFQKNGKVLFKSKVAGDDKEHCYGTLSAVLSGASEGETVYITEEVKNLSENDAQLYLAAYVYVEGQAKVDISAAPDTKFSFIDSTGYAHVQSQDGNIVTMNAYDLASLKFKATSAYTSKKSIKVTVKPDANSKPVIDSLKKAGYKFEYKFYRSTKKSSGYSVKKTTKNSYYTNTSGKKGTRYYYKAKVNVYNPEGEKIYTTELKNCSAANRTWKKK